MNTIKESIIFEINYSKDTKMTSIKEKITALKRSQLKVMTEFAQNQQLVYELEPAVHQRCKQELDSVFGVRTLSSICLSAGFASTTWEPEVFVYPLQRDKQIFIKINNEWTWYDEEYVHVKHVYSHKILKNKDFPFDPIRLEETCKRLEDELGVKISIVTYFIKVIDSPKNIDDLKEAYPDLNILLQGEIYSMGWDIPDYYAIVCIDGEKHIFFSTDGHGMGYDYHIRPGEDYLPFYQFMSRSRVKKDQKQKIKNILRDKNC